MEVLDTKLKGVNLIKVKVSEDFRGSFTRSFSEKDYRFLDIKFVEDGFSASNKDVLRGIHGDPNNSRIYSCPFGRVYNVVVNCNPNSKEFGKWQGFMLSKENGFQLFVSPMIGNAYLVLSDEAIVHYKRSTYYNGSKEQFTYKFDEPKFGIYWPIKNPILSKRDSEAKYLS